MNMSDVYAIVDIEGYASEMREAAAKTISDSHEDNLDDFISIDQMIGLVKENCVGFDDNDRPLLNEDANEIIYESTVSWIHGVGLAKLASKGLIECAWDNDTNGMIFWSNEIKSDDSKSKGKSNDKRRNKKKN
jgi:hypothetical protein